MDASHDSPYRMAEVIPMSSCECLKVSQGRLHNTDFADFSEFFTSGIQLANKLSKEREDGKLGFHLKESYIYYNG